MSSEVFPPQVVKNKLSEISSCFCIAKWTQVSIHLQNGTTHSCHHPKVHKIDEKLLNDNPSALHNTPQKLSERADMLKGARPKGCDYCWRVEDLPGENISDRIYKSGFDWSMPHLPRVLKNPLDPKFNPTYVEVNLGSICNFKCSYCSPDVSSSWGAEVQRHGVYPTSSKHPWMDPQKRVIAPDEPNPYRDAFFKWWPDLYPSLHTFRVTGGEPLLNKDLGKILDWIQEHPKPDLILGINTNLCPPEDIWQKFLQDIKKISDGGFIKSLEIFTSAEAWGAQAEYIRHGMNFELWRKRMWELLEEVPQARLTIMVTYNALSIFSFDELLSEVIRIKSNELFYSENRFVPLLVDISYLRYPQHQAVKVLTPNFQSRLEAQLQYMQEHKEVLGQDGNHQRGFLPHEIEKMERICNWFSSDKDDFDAPEVKRNLQKDFYLFFNEHDRRRKTDFLKTFPDFSEFWSHCARL